MAYDYSQSLNPQKALIFRIVHRDNLEWILTHGLWAGNGQQQNPHWVHIGLPELIAKRARHPVPLAPYGVLNDYVPFYFTPFSPMLSNIHSGRGVPQRENDEILILVSNLIAWLNWGYRLCLPIAMPITSGPISMSILAIWGGLTGHCCSAVTSSVMRKI